MVPWPEVGRMAEPTLEFDASRKKVTIEFNEPPGPETLETLAAQLRKNEMRSVHAMVGMDWEDPDAPDWDDPRHVSQLAKVLPPSLESFIFDVPYHTVARQGFNTVGDFCEVLEACPKLARAFLTGCSEMRKTRHEHLRELHLLGYPLDPSIISGLASSQFPALETLVLQGLPGVESYDDGEDLVSPYPALAERRAEATSRMEELAACLRTIEAPRLTAYIDGVPVLRFLNIIGKAPLPCDLCVMDAAFDNVDGLFAVLQRHDALRSGRLRLDSQKFFDSEIAKLKDMGVTVEASTDPLSPGGYEDW
jgi:hypothetical protein